MGDRTRTDETRTIAELRVLRAMHPGVVACAPDASLRDVARIMAANNVHAVCLPPAVPSDGTWRMFSAFELVAALCSGLETRLAASVATSPAVFVGSDETLERAALLLVERGTSHLVVRDADTSHPVGILSTLDIASAVARVPLRSGPPRRRANVRR
jgi:CBS domain-containing protein